MRGENARQSGVYNYLRLHSLCGSISIDRIADFRTPISFAFIYIRIILGAIMAVPKIIILSDGTGNAASSVWRTNVWRIFQSLDLRSNDQAAKYDDGVGTSSFLPLAILGGAFGFGLKRNILDAYKFICRNYDHADGSKIYLLGFIGLPPEYVTVGNSGAITLLGPTTFETPAQARARYAAQERLWNFVWLRRLPATILFTYLTETGLTIQIPAGSVPGAPQQTPARICFDEVYANFTNEQTLSQALHDLFFFNSPSWVKMHNLKPRANNSGIEFFERISDVPGDSLRYNQPVVRHYRCDDPSTPWIKAAGSQVGGATPSAGAKAPAFPDRAKGDGSLNKSAAYEFYDRRTDAIFQIFTRSTWGIYQYLGKLVSRERQNGVPSSVLVRGYQKDHELFHVDHNVGSCFTAVIYSEAYHCVPKQRYNTKQTLSLLHELVNLSTRPNSAQQPNTGTTRVTN
jgi:Uncharacterized alpha/beta hydrolase domain (DUF2235)